MSFAQNWATSKVGFKIGVRYRFNFIIGMITVPLSLLMYFFLWKAIFAYTGDLTIRGFTFTQMVNYYTISMIVGFFTWIDIDKWMSHDIRTGYTVRDLLKPMTYFSQWVYFEIGINALGILIQLLPIFIIGFVFFDLPVASLFIFITFFISLAFAFLIAFMISYMLGLTAFWLKEISGLRRVRRVMIVFLSGGIVPLTFFPERIQNLFHYLPFEYIRSVPINLYLGTYSTLGVLTQLGIQLVWIVVLYTIIRLIWRKALSKFAGSGT